MDELATAHEHWDAQWQDAEARASWEVPEDRVLGCARDVLRHGGQRALDLGCGVGRHALALARLGFAVDAIDMAPAGLVRLAALAEQNGLAVATQTASMTELPFDDGSFDYIVSWNVIYHGDEAIVRGCLGEIRRVLRPGGTYQGTMLTKRNRNFGRGEEVAPDTWVNPGTRDKAHPHYYCDAAGLVALFEGFEMLTLEDYEQRPGSNHWHVIAERRFE